MKATDDALRPGERTGIGSRAQRLYGRIRRHRVATSFAAVAALILVLDRAAPALFSPIAGSALLPRQAMDFAPEVWIGLLALVLGTLIIVVSIASQSIPKLIDHYINDRVSQLYIWLIVLTLLHNLWLQVEPEVEPGRVFLSIGVFMLSTILLSLPYIYYILGRTKPAEVIARIHRENLRQIRRMERPTVRAALRDPRLASAYQFRLFDSLNQLADLLAYLDFKEPRAQIIRGIGEAAQSFIRIKPRLPDTMLAVGPQIRDDISFKTLSGQFEEIERRGTFYEQKSFRLLGNAYNQLIEAGEFELSTLCVTEIAEVGRTAIECGDEAVLDLVTVRFNTLLRFGIKHGVRTPELRNLYNALYHYRTFVEWLVAGGKQRHVTRCCEYLQTYGSEIYRISRNAPAFSLLVDVVAAEMRSILIAVSEAGWPEPLQQRLLSLLLELDTPPDVDRAELGANEIIYDRVRTLQVSLALYYIRAGRDGFVDRIIDDILADGEHLTERQLRQAIREACDVLEEAEPTFWEDTDRGNANLYYSEDVQYLPDFRDRLDARLAAGPDRIRVTAEAAGD